MIGACYVCFGRPEAAGEKAWAAAVVTRGGRRPIAGVVVSGVAGADYEPGLLALREGPLLGAAVRALAISPDVLLVNATGRDHPRGAGLALHIGAVLAIPTIGVTHRTLIAAGALPSNSRGARAPLLIGAKIVGCWLRTRPGARPVAVHIGWRTELEGAAQVVLAASRRARTPEPLRRARRLARLARAGYPNEVENPTEPD
jgi:deoxyribonuclease V